jgi:hypothetical protein
MEESMFDAGMLDAGRRPLRRLLGVVALMALACGIPVARLAAAPAPQSGPPLTTVSDTVYRADGTPAQGTLVITWPAFLTASGTAIAAGTKNVTLGTSGQLSTGLVPNVGNKSGAEKKDAAMSFLENALAMSDAIAAREIVNPEEFKDGISQIIDGVVRCMNASAWTKGSAEASAVSHQP